MNSMVKTNEGHIRTPTYYVLQRIKKNYPAVFGFFIIVLAHIVSILGYLIMPDSTPNANDGAVQLQKQLPGFTVTVLKKIKNQEIEKRNFLMKILFGQESQYTIVPITSYKINGWEVEVTEFGRRNKKETYSLLSLTRPTYVGKSNKIFKDSSSNFLIEGLNVTYVDLYGNVKKATREELVNEFKQNNIEKRTYWLGTDKAGRDMLSRLLFGTRISLSIGFISVLISLAVGITLGAIAGFFGGLADNIVMWIMTVVWSIPSIMLVIAISLALQSKGLWVAFVAVGLTTWVEVARVVRGQIMSIKEKTFVEAARALGLSNTRIIFRHILPNLIGPLIVIATANFASAILIEAGLSFLGLGVQPPMPSWGMMINEGFHSMGSKDAWHLILFPSVSISLLVLSFNLFGNGLRDAFDPQSYQKK